MTTLVMASTAETARLLKAYRLSGDLGAREQLVTNYVPLVRRLCRRFRASREPQEDLFQVGAIGLLNAIDKFDPERGASFSSLAIPEILGAILNFLRDHGSILKIPRTIRKNKLAVDKASDVLVSSLGRWPTPMEVAEACHLSEQEVFEAAKFGRMGDPRSLDEKMTFDDADGALTLSEYLGQEDVEFELSLDRMTLATALQTLPAREQRILRLRYYNEMSQRQIAELVGISQMHVSRLERSALYKLSLLMRRRSPPGAGPEAEAALSAFEAA